MSGRNGWRLDRIELTVLPALFIIGLIIRTIFASNAPGLWYDEAIYGLDSLSVLREPGWPIFFDTGNHMREPMYMYIQAVMLAITGPTAFAIRLTSAIIGTLTIPVVWLLGREFGGRAFGLVAAALFTVLPWHVHFSGLAFRTILSPLFSALTMLFLLRYFRTNKTRDAVWTGVFLGLGVYTYLAFRLMPFVVAVPLAVHWWRNSTDRRRIARNASILYGIAFLLFLPLGINFLRNPQHFTGRSDEVSLTQRPDAVRLVLRQARDVAMMPMLRGDHVGKHNIPGPPQFLQPFHSSTERVVEAWQIEHAMAEAQQREPHDPHGTGRPVFAIVGALLFYVGIGTCLFRFAEARNAALVSWIILGATASVLSFGAPNLLRMLMISPAAVLLVVKGLESAASFFRGRKNMVYGTLVLLLLGEATLRTAVHARQWPDHPLVVREFNVELADIGKYLAEQSDRLPVRLSFAEHPTLTFIADGYRFNPAPEELGERWWEFRTVPPFPPLEPVGVPLPGGRSRLIDHPAGIPMGELVEVGAGT